MRSLLLLLFIHYTCAFIPSARRQRAELRLKESSDNSATRKDDVPDRFKYKVHALMGTYDTMDSSTDTEEQGGGRILGALAQFPTEHTFSIVVHKEYEDAVAIATRVVTEGSGDSHVECKCMNRGTKFSKIELTAQVDSASIITNVQEMLRKELGDGIVMLF